jgi:arylsulfatase A-like enzyme
VVRSVVVVSIDTLRPDMLGCYGYDRPTSPALDRLAAQGVVFTEALSPSPWALPAHGTMLTGLYPRRHGANSSRRGLSGEVTTLAEILAGQGYTTAAFVTSHFVGERYGFDRGFLHFEELDEHSADVIDRAAEWLRDAPSSGTFLFVHDYQVHSDYTPGPEAAAVFTRPYDGAVDGTTRQLKHVRSGELVFTDRDVEHLRDLYAAEIRQMDEALGRLIEALDDDTLLVVTSDHGEEFLDHGGVLHGRTHYDELLRVPLVLRGPGVPAGRTVEAPVSLVDVLPTILSAVDVPVPDALDGIDLSALWAGGASAPDRVIFGEADHNNVQDDMLRSARYRGFKLVQDRVNGTSELYDLSADPLETRNVLDEHPEVRDALAEQIRRFDAVRGAGKSLPPLEPEVVKQLEELGYLK